MVWNHSVTTKTACVRTAHTLHLNLKICAARSGRVCGVATHAVDRGAGYGLLHLNLEVCVSRSSRVYGVATHMFSVNACYGLLLLEVIGRLKGKGN